jgi:hypothetical protein
MTCQQCGSAVRDDAKFCPQCGWKVASGPVSISPPPAPFVSKKKLVYGALIVVALVSGISVYLKVLLREYHPVIAEQPEVVVEIQYGIEQKIPSAPVTATLEGEDLTIPLNVVLSNKIVRFFDPAGEQHIPLIAYVTPEGKIVTAMSISENCQSTDFYLKGHNIHCANCPSYWNMSSLEAYACCPMLYPDPIPSRLENGKIRINAAVVRAWKTRS